MSEAYRLPNGVLYEIDDEHQHVATHFPDRTTCPGVPSLDDESVARARALGYEGPDADVVWQMTRDHDLLHSVIALNLDGGESHALRYDRRHRQPDASRKDRRQAEERLCFLVQRALNASSMRELLADYFVAD